MKKLLVLALAGVMSMAILGVGYALWFDTLTIKGSVKTGTLDLVLSGPVITEEGAGELAKPDVANCLEVADADRDVITVDVTNAYPSYQCRIRFDVTSIGSIPAHIHTPVAAAGNPAWVKLENCYANETQLHLNQSAYCDIVIHFSNTTVGVEQDTTYSWSFQVNGHQFNEEPPATWNP